MNELLLIVLGGYSLWIFCCLFIPIYKYIEYKIKKQKEADRITAQKLEFPKLLEALITKSGSRYEKSPHYPKDWRIRRQLVLLRQGFKCENCYRNFHCRFQSSADIESDLISNEFSIHRNKVGYICSDAHIHHIKNLRHGGTHELENLQLLCEYCHSMQPGHEPMKQEVRVKNYKNSYRAKNTLKTARIKHLCQICEHIIKPKDKYYGSTTNYYGIKSKSCICYECYKKYEKH